MDRWSDASTEEVSEELRQRVPRMVSEGMSDRARFGRASMCTPLPVAERVRGDIAMKPRGLDVAVGVVAAAAS